MEQQHRGKPAIYSLPMPQMDFQLAREVAYQEMELQPDVVREGIRHRRALEREENKSHHRQLEVLQKQMAREKTYKIFCCKNSIQLSIINGTTAVIADKILFSCGVTQLKCYRYDNEDCFYWQIILAEQGGNPEVASQLYNADLLTSPNKLRGTILSNYICVNDSRIDALAWRWMFSQLNLLYEDADIIELPFKAGWFQTENKWHFWTDSGDYFLLSEQVKKFSADYFENLDANVTIASFLDTILNGCTSQYIMAILLTFRVSALLGRLVENVSPPLSLTIIGKEARQVAETYLRTMHNEVDIINLDSDRIGNIRKRVNNLQDTPVIFVSSEPNSKSTQNRIREARSWMNTGVMEGMKVTVPFVFCLTSFSKEYPLADTVVINASKYILPNGNLFFAQIQSMVISNIESSGEYWVSELRKQFKKNRGQLALFKAVNRLLLKMFESDLDATTNAKLKELFRSGEEEIERQFSLKGGILLETFRESVLRLVDGGSLLVVDKDKCPNSSNTMHVFYDNMCYYLIQDIFDFICQQANIDSKSVLSIKQQLLEQDFVKIYRHNGFHNRELVIDFIVRNACGQKINLSGLAIRREFFDNVGGVTLFERSKQDEIKM